MSIIFAMAIFAIVLAYAFEAVNGFHDTAHACATSVASGALTYRQAVWMSGLFNALGAATAGTAVAVFITKIVSVNVISMQLVVSTLLAGLVWNLYSWYKAIPVSSSHCLIGSLVGAGLAAAGWNGVNLGEFYKALISLFTSPFIGFVMAMIVARIIVRFAGKPGATSPAADKWMPWAQRITAAAVSYGHGANDGQKTMGIVALILIAGFGYGDAASLTGKLAIPMWVVLSCAATIGLGTVFGARRIIDTVSHKLSVEKITYHDGLAAESVTAVLVLWGSHLGLPLSTTQTCTSSVLGASRGVHRRDTLNWVTVRKMVAAWIATFITTGALAAGFYLLLHHLVG